MFMKSGLSAAFIALVCCSFVKADIDSVTGLPEGLKVRTHAYGHFESGQIERGSLLNNVADITLDKNDYKIDHVWTEDALIWAGFEATYHDNFKMFLELGTKLYFSYPQEGTTNRYTKNNRQDVFLEKAYSQYKIGNTDKPLLLWQVGYFDFKYNPYVRNLGEYMFRTGTYPIYFDMGFDNPQQHLLGLHLQSNVLESIKFDALFVSATSYPTMNWSLAFLGSYDVANMHIIDIGGGIDFAHLFDVYTRHAFLQRLGGDPTEPHLALNDAYVDANGDTAYYTFKGTKLMGRISFDPKPILNLGIFGKEDLKLYAEVDIIGLKSYPDSAVLIGGQAQADSSGKPIKKLAAPSYNKLLEKMPIVVGVNIPTFKALDILNFELEWFGAKYYNDASGVLNQGSAPLPYGVDNPDLTRKYPVKSHWKWSVYAKRSFFGGHFSLVGQVARDHMRLQTAAYDNELYNELLIEPQDWWWTFKTCWSF
jgi:hypothetical protein